jgi:hypothetical protein
MLPLVLARRDGDAMLARGQAALRERPESELTWLAEQTPGWDLILRSLRIDVYDLGMAVMNATFLVRLPSDTNLRLAARTLKAVAWLKPDPATHVESPVVAAFRLLAKETAEQFAASLARGAPDVAQKPWLSPFVDAVQEDDSTGRRESRDWGRLLWLHPVHVFDATGTGQSIAATAAELAPPIHRKVEIPDGLFLPGIGSSAIVTQGGASDAAIPLRITELHWAYIALYLEIDRGLLALLDDDRWYAPESLAELEQDADRVFGDYMRVMEARARLDSALASLGGDELALWEFIADVQKFDALVEAVERKVEVLQRLAERRVQQAAAGRERRTSGILSGLTALTVVTVAVALIGNFLGSRADTLGHVELRIAIVAAAFAVTIGLYREAFRERIRRRDRAR